jgi:WD40 repeat protein
VDEWVSMLAFGPHAKLLLSDDPDGAGPPRIWSLDDGSQQILRTPDSEHGRRLAFVFMEDGAAVRVATSSTADDETETLRVWHWEVASGSTHVLFERAGLQAVQAARGMHNLIIQTVDGRALLWHLKDDAFRVLPPMEGVVRSFDISPDGRTILTGRWGSGRDDQRFEWMVDVASGQGQQLRTLFTPLAWSPDGRTLADVYRRREVRLWRDPTPDTPREFLDWLDAVTDMQIERSRLR